MPPICPGTGLPSQSVRDHGAPPTQNPAMPTLSFAIQEQYNSHSKPNNPHRPTKIHHIFTRTPSSSVSDSPSRSRSHQPNPTQSTILTQSTCNLGIPLQSENGWARDYRTRERGRANAPREGSLPTRHLSHDPRRNTFSPHAITEIPTRRKDPSIAAPLHTVDRDLHMPTPNPISAIPMQSTIKLQSCCNHKIPMQWKNGWAGDYRTREASRAQPFSHCARIRRLRRNPADRNPHTQGLRPISNPGEHKSFSVAAKRRKGSRPRLHLPPSPPFTKHDNITAQPAQSQCNQKSRCIPSAFKADTQTWQPRSIPQKRAHPNPPSTTPNQSLQSLRNLKSWRNYSAILKSPRIRRTVGPEYIEPEEHPEATSGTAAPTLTTQGWYTTRSQGHSITNVSDHSRAVHHSIPFPISRQSKTPAQQTPTAIQNTTVPTQS